MVVQFVEIFVPTSVNVSGALSGWKKNYEICQNSVVASHVVQIFKEWTNICNPDNFEFMILVLFEVLVVLTLNIRSYSRLGWDAILFYRYDTFIYWVTCSLFLRNVSIHLQNYTKLHLRRHESPWFLISFRFLMTLKMLWHISSCLFRLSASLNVMWKFPHSKTS